MQKNSEAGIYFCKLEPRIPFQLISTQLLAEEVIVALKNHGTDDMNINIFIRKKLGDVHIDVDAPGRPIDTAVIDKAGTEDIIDPESNMDDPALERAIRAIILKAQGERLKYSHSEGINYISIAAGKAERSSLILTTYALIAGIAAGLILKFVFPAAASDILCRYALDPVKTMFMNALKIIIGPVIFFSIVTCLSQFKNLTELGRIGVKVMGMYLMTTLAAAALAVVLSSVFSPGTWGAGLSTATQAVEVDTSPDTSLLSTIINIVPDNFLKPFLQSDTLQLIFLAVLCGLAVGAVGKYSARLSSLLEALNELFLTITAMISRLIPVAAFCSVALMVVQLGGEMLLSLLGFIGCFLCAVFCMLTVYGILIFLAGRLNPVTFYKKAREGMLTSLALSSSSAAMPTNMRICTDRLGISPKLASFSIPLGATVNMDGATMFLIICGLFLAKMYAVPVTASTVASLIITVIMLSLGAPGVPGAGIVCLGVVLAHLGVPLEAVGLVIAVNPFTDMLSTMNNTTGDMAVTVIIARIEGMLDREVYERK
ncbi:MAG: dicarboxylate/amino acid:cation symporter [Lachnospiraceae bacterium]|nr:dicarboxylate/amino acid:cation symporter [Lachnospiraceae bacterium]